MCGRFASFLPAEAIARIFGTVNPLPNLAPSWNVAPTSDVAVVRRDPETGARRRRPANDVPHSDCRCSLPATSARSRWRCAKDAK
jgi:putative SOS response-associated peptidase YedK